MLRGEWSQANKSLQMQIKKEATFHEGIQTLLSLREALFHELLQLKDELPREAFKRILDAS